MTPEKVLRTFAELAGTQQAGPETDVLGSSSLFVWQRYTAIRLLTPSLLGGSVTPVSAMPGTKKATAERLFGASELHRSEQLLRAGWVWFAGQVERDGETVRYCVPAVSAPVARVSGVLSPVGKWAPALQANLERIGDLEATDLIVDGPTRDRLARDVQFGGGALVDSFQPASGYRGVNPNLLPRLSLLVGWYRSVAAAAGIPLAEELVVHEANPDWRRTQPGVAAIVGCGLYLHRPAPAGTRRESLLATAAIGGLDDTALGHVYRHEKDNDGDRGTGSTERGSDQDRESITLRPVSARQRSIVEAVIDEPVAVLSGAPGTGKSHLLTVIALEAVARGQSVLVAAGSPYAVDVLIEHFRDAPGPTPLAFGGSVHGNRLAAELTELASRHDTDAVVTVDADEHARLLTSVQTLLEAEAAARRLKRHPGDWLDVSERLDRAGDLHELGRLVGAMGRRGPVGWWHRLRHRTTVAGRLGTDGSDRHGFGTALSRLRAGAAARRILAVGGLALDETFDEIVRLEGRASRQRGDRLVEQWLQDLSGGRRRTLGLLANALALGRSERRAAFARIDPNRLTGAAPLWVGSVRDVDEVLPLVPGLFDLLILDEASQMNQLSAVNALVRAKRVIVCGDPHQLGHINFTSDDAIVEAALAHDVDPHLINPRRLSVFDVASINGPLHVLDEHFRSAPHLIEFSARRIYGGSLHVVTRCPANEAADHIDVRLVDGTRNRSKVNETEIKACLDAGRHYIDLGYRSIGFISPFRAQADALQEALLDSFRLEEIDHYGLRVGTVHGFQGDERDVIIASWAVGADEGDGPWRFVNQRDLFNVMVTRARDRMEIVTSVAKPPGLAGEYLRWSEPLTDLVTDEALDDPWIETVARAAAENGSTVRTGYRVGRHLLDVVVGQGADAVAVDCVPHPDGPQAHIDRALMIRRGGWRTTDAFPSRWSDEPGRLGIELQAMIRSATAGSDHRRHLQGDG